MTKKQQRKRCCFFISKQQRRTVFPSPWITFYEDSRIVFLIGYIKEAESKESDFPVGRPAGTPQLRRRRSGAPHPDSTTAAPDPAAPKKKVRPWANLPVLLTLSSFPLRLSFVYLRLNALLNDGADLVGGHALVIRREKGLEERGIPLRKHRSKKGNTGPIGVLCGLEIAPLFLRPHACR